MCVDILKRDYRHRRDLSRGRMVLGQFDDFNYVDLVVDSLEDHAAGKASTKS